VLAYSSSEGAGDGEADGELEDDGETEGEVDGEGEAETEEEGDALRITIELSNVSFSACGISGGKEAAMIPLASSYEITPFCIRVSMILNVSWSGSNGPSLIPMFALYHKSDNP
jgi:hypothetical protein